MGSLSLRPTPPFSLAQATPLPLPGWEAGFERSVREVWQRSGGEAAAQWVSRQAGRLIEDGVAPEAIGKAFLRVAKAVGGEVAKDGVEALLEGVGYAIPGLDVAVFVHDLFAGTAGGDPRLMKLEANMPRPRTTAPRTAGSNAAVSDVVASRRAPAPAPAPARTPEPTALPAAQQQRIVVRATEAAQARFQRPLQTYETRLGQLERRASALIDAGVERPGVREHFAQAAKALDAVEDRSRRLAVLQGAQALFSASPRLSRIVDPSTGETFDRKTLRDRLATVTAQLDGAARRFVAQVAVLEGRLDPKPSKPPGDVPTAGDSGSPTVTRHAEAPPPLSTALPARVWVDRNGGAAASTERRPGAVPIEWVDRLPGQGRRVDLWVEPDSGRVRADDPRDGRSVRMAAEIDPAPGGKIVVSLGSGLQRFVPGRSPAGGAPPGGGPGRGPRGPSAAEVLKWVGLVAPTLVFLQYQADQASMSPVETRSPAARNAGLIDKLVDPNTTLTQATAVRDQIWINHLDAAMQSLRQAKQGGGLFGFGRFSDAEVDRMQQQVDLFKAGLAKQPPLAPADAQQPSSLRFVYNASFDYNKKNEAAALAFDLANQFAAADTRALALKFFGRSDQVPAVTRFDVDRFLAGNPAITRAGPKQAEALAGAETLVWRHYLAQVPSLMGWSDTGAQARAYRRGLERWLADGANFEESGSRLRTARVAFDPSLVMDAPTSQQLALKLGPLAASARLDIDAMRTKAPLAPSGEAGVLQQVHAELQRQQEQDETAAKTVVAPLRHALDDVQRRLALEVPGDALPAALQLPAGDGPIDRPAAEVLQRRLAGADARLATIDQALATWRTKLLFETERRQGDVRNELLDLGRLGDTRLATVRDLRSKLRAVADELVRRAARSDPGAGAASPPPVAPLALPTAPALPSTRLPIPAVVPSPTLDATPPTPLPAPSNEQGKPFLTPVPDPGLTPMPLPAYRSN